MPLFLCLLLCSFEVMADKRLCQMMGSPQYPLLSKDGDVSIGGAFSIHSKITQGNLTFSEKPQPPACFSLNLREFRFAQTMIFAIEQINKKNDLLPNISIGYKIFDSCGSTLTSMRSTMALINGQDLMSGQICSGKAPVKAIIGESESSSSIVLARTSGPFKIPVISHFATCACLSNRREFPSFFRTIPSDYYQSRALVQLVRYFGWTWVGAVRSDNDYGNNGMATFVSVAGREGVCIEYSEAILRTNSREKIAKVVEVIKKGTARVLVAFLAQSEMEVLLDEILAQNVSGLQWVGSESWITARHLATQSSLRVISGAIGFTIRKSKIPGLKDFLLKVHPRRSPSNALLREFWETTFECKFNQNSQNDKVKLCTGLESLANVSNTFTDVMEFRVSNNVYKAVYAVAHALHKMLTCRTSFDQFRDKTCFENDTVEPEQVLRHLREVDFTTHSGERVYFNYNGDPVAKYELVNWQKNESGIMFVTVGHYDASQSNKEQFNMNPVPIVWAGNTYMRPRSVCSDSCLPGFRRAPIKGKPACCFACIQCPAGEISNMTDSTECIKCPLEYWSSKDHSQCILKRVEFLSFHENMGIVLAAFSVIGASLTIAVALMLFHFRETPLVKAINSEMSSLLLFSLSLCFLCSLTFIGQPSLWSCCFRHISFGITFALCMSCVLAKTITVVMAFRATVPGANIPQCSVPLQRISVFSCTLFQVIICAFWVALAPPVPHRNAEHSADKVILECDVGSAVGFWAVLGYIGLLASLCFVLAFLARKLPDNFNEAKFITFSILIFCAVWITFIPAYVSSPGKFTVAVEIFAILASSYGLLFCIFIPKCYIIMLKPEKNTRKFVIGKAHGKSQ
ncbi:olfactory receptor CH1 [Chanos chanos]|uniref:Olfactory receptor CH1 n=1 Tax=Chanos chanos TaxID=29144 RepID=A0A6J2UPX1_CHACN|nr:extracellular calcium-sensing receptor-like [Chanos chanos]